MVSTSRALAIAGAVVGAAGLGLGILSVALVGGLGSSTTYDTTYGDASAAFALLEVAVGTGLLLVGLVLLAQTATAVLGMLVVACSAAWFAPLWVGWEGGPAIVRNAGLIVAPLLPAFVLGVAALMPPSAAGWRRVALRAVVAVGILGTAAVSVALALVLEPIRDRYCWNDCTRDPFLVSDDIELARRLTSILLAFAAAGAVVAALIAVVRLARAAPVTRRSSGPAFAAVALAGIALAAYAASLHFEPRELPDRSLYAALFVARSLSLLVLAAALAWLAVRPTLVRGRVTRLAVDLERSAAAGGLGPLLARTLGDPGLRLGYPVGTGSRIVDADGRALAFDDARHVTTLVTGDEVVALVESDVRSVGALEHELGPAVRLALGNERLRSESLARLEDVTRSRARIVETADAARRRMERDLHDGAQQRLLALTYDLRVALTIAEGAGDDRVLVPLRTGLARVAAASEELREIAHGIFPAELASSGLEAALESLADVRPLRLAVDLPAGRRYRPDVEMAAYAAVVDAVDAQADGGGMPVLVTIGERDGRLRLTVDGVESWGDRLVLVEDRVLATGGELTAETPRLEVALPA